MYETGKISPEVELIIYYSEILLAAGIVHVYYMKLQSQQSCNDPVVNKILLKQNLLSAVTHSLGTTHSSTLPQLVFFTMDQYCQFPPATF